MQIRLKPIVAQNFSIVVAPSPLLDNVQKEGAFFLEMIFLTYRRGQGSKDKNLQAKGWLALWEPESCQNKGGSQHPRGDPKAYPKPERMVSIM